MTTTSIPDSRLNKATGIMARITLVVITAFCLITSASSAAEPYREVEWTELMPKEDLAALLDPPDFLNGIEDGSQQDSVAALNQRDITDQKAERYRDALSSTRPIAEFDQQAIRIPGYIVPLAQNEQRRVTSFFVVPYFGACLHMPPPPPNQILFVNYPQGIELQNLQQPFWFEGKLNIEISKHDLGTSAYTLHVNNYQLYE
ncbi:DUF3299 domain-containing protein [uncultured Alteromonas sp.]|jgi:hypothetical protein|uniref:DUF3299 domain-containing protein n=1 Tax=uncultured Alteromonas sp. TaxID=179113 RepID=UPI0025F0F7EE|nr:DUF3299 domain-containing protein [uncultured Alteromonas sp.]